MENGGEWWSTLEKLECLNSVIMGAGPGYNAVLQCLFRISSSVQCLVVPRNISANVQKMVTSAKPQFYKSTAQLADVDLRRSDVTSTGDLHF